MTANETIKKDYPQYSENGKYLTLVVKKGKGFVVGTKGGETRLFMDDGKLNPKISKTDMKVLGSKRTELIQRKDEEIEAVEKTIQEDTRVTNDENEEPSVRERAREKKKTENTERKTHLENEREQLVEKLPLRERIKELFKKYGWTLTAVLLAVGATIGNIVSWLSNGIQSATDKVSKGLKDLGTKIGSILAGLLGAIVSFVFRTAGQVISCLGRNAWLSYPCRGGILDRNAPQEAAAKRLIMFLPRQPGLLKQAHPKPQVPCLHDADRRSLWLMPVLLVSVLITLQSLSVLRVSYF